MNNLVLIADSLTLVRFRFALEPDVGRRLPHLLFVDAAYHDSCLGAALRVLGGNLNSFRGLVNDRMGVADIEGETLALHIRSEPNAVNIEALLKAGAHAGHGIGDERPDQTVE